MRRHGEAAAAPGEAAAAHYDALDLVYRAVWGEHIHHGFWETGRESDGEAAAALARHAAAPLGLRPGSAVCDVGSGRGAVARLLAAEFGARVTAVTVSPVQHAAARAGRREFPSRGAVIPVLGDWLDNELPDGSFDTVISIECLSHISGQPKFFSEVSRVLKPGGRAVITCLAAGNRAASLDGRILVAAIRRGGALARISAPSEWRAMAEAAGLEVENLTDWSRRVRATWSRILVRGARHLQTARAAPRRAIPAACAAAAALAAFHTGSLVYACLALSRPSLAGGA